MGIPNFLKPAKPVLKWMGKTVFPRQYWRYKFRSLSEAVHEPELRLLPFLCSPRKTSVDIGASAGVFSVHMLKASRDVVAFEPRPDQADELAQMFANLGVPARVEAVALSNRVGTSQMRMLLDDLGRSTIEAENSLEDEDGSAEAPVTVQVRKLDDYRLDDVAFIKIDVEGHEVAVLEGARETIVRNLPFLLIESEDRHRKNAVADVTAFLRQVGYSGFFLQDGHICAMDTFDPATHQDSRNIGGWKSGWARRGIYVNNFLFMPMGQEVVLTEAVQKMKAEKCGA